MTPFLRVRLVLALGGLIAGCTALAGVEDEYSPRHPAEVQASGGTQSATGGSSGGSVEAGAATGGGGAGGGASCGSGLKLCGGGCRTPDALIGCSSQGCEPCPVATNAEAYCEAGQCALRCPAGYEWDGSACVVSSGSGGTGGTGGAGGTGGGSGGTGGATACIPSACQPCPLMPPLSTSCCLPNDTCGFMYPGQPCTACGQ